MPSNIFSKILSNICSQSASKIAPSLGSECGSSSHEPRFKLFVLESVCAPCVQNMGQWTNPNAMAQPGGNHHPCPQNYGTPPTSQNSPQNPLPSGNGTALNWQQQAVNDTMDRAIRYSTHERPRMMNNLPAGNSGRR